MTFTEPTRWETRVVRALSAARARGELAGIRLLVDGLRPEGGRAPAAHVEAFTAYLLSADPAVRAEVAALVRGLLGHARVFPALTASGVPGGEGFVPELVARLGRRVLPAVPDPTDLRDHVRAAFAHPRDHLWVEAVPDPDWRRLLDVLGITAESVRGVDREVALAIRVLAHHAASLGLRPEVLARLPHLERPDSPFLVLGERVLRYLESFENEVEGDEEPLLDEALATVAACRREVMRLRAEGTVHGTSLWLTGLSYRLLRVLDRIALLLRLTEPVERDFQGSAVRLFKEVVRAEKTRDHLAPHVRESADLLALEVVEHAARTGSKYITTGRRDYLAFLVSSMGGGLLVAFASIAKTLMGRWSMAPAVEALVYGLNYSICFVLIYVTGSTLATKQPAMTANTLARSLGEEGDDLAGLENLIVRTWRSQFISFVGNVAVAVPVGVALAALFAMAAGQPAASPEKAATMLGALHPWRSASLAWAAVAGVLLFGAGLVSGWVANWTRHRDVPARIAHHPRLARAFGPRRTRGAAAAVDRHLGPLAGNVFLGFGLGSMAALGQILGVPLDIRHITFAAAQAGTAFEVLGGRAPAGLLAAVAVGVALIGLVNFLVSFGLSLAVALESRQVGFRGTRRLLARLARRLRTRPLEWLVPPRGDGSGRGEVGTGAG